VQKIILILLGIFLISFFSNCSTTKAIAGDPDYTETISRLQRRINDIEARNSELETRLGELIAENRRYADYYQSATATIKSSLSNADKKAGSLEERIERLLRINDQLTELIQQIADEEYQAGGKEQVSE
jgi:prefoldin subunit 5